MAQGRENSKRMVRGRYAWVCAESQDVHRFAMEWLFISYGSWLLPCGMQGVAWCGGMQVVAWCGLLHACRVGVRHDGKNTQKAEDYERLAGQVRNRSTILGTQPSMLPVPGWGSLSGGGHAVMAVRPAMMPSEEVLRNE